VTAVDTELHLPAECGPVLATWVPVPRAERAAQLLRSWPLLVAIVGILWLRAPNLPYVTIPVGLAAYVLIVRVASVRELRAGDGWVATESAYVRTDRLVRLRYRGTLHGPELHMRDDSEREIAPGLRDLVKNPEIWKLISAGVERSYAQGLRPDRATSRIFGLPFAPK
jgi:hypothetical protein